MGVMPPRLRTQQWTARTLKTRLCKALLWEFSSLHKTNLIEVVRNSRQSLWRFLNAHTDVIHHKRVVAGIMRHRAACVLVHGASILHTAQDFEIFGSKVAVRAYPCML